MKFISTRNNKDNVDFKDVTLKGLALDGGLYIPEKWRKINPDIFNELNFKETVFQTVKIFSGNSICEDLLKNLIDKSYSNFSSDEITPIRKLDNNKFLLELFHGPTLAFKDIALQLLGNLFDHFLENKSQKLIIIGATSGDTGSAAIEAIKESKYAKIFILHPHNRVSEFQRKQMTTVNTNNVYNLAIRGNFDDCQNIIKRLFRDNSLNNLKLGSINSINWTRIMTQISYYIYAFYKIKRMTNKKNISFSVPTGNFGDVYAGYLAKKRFNIPITKLIVATNKNNILDRVFKTGIYKREKVYQTISPSMDIQVASNFERLLYDLYQLDSSKVNMLMEKFKNEGKISIDKSAIMSAREDFISFSVNEKDTAETIRSAYKNYNIVIDPHSAIGLASAKSFLVDKKDHAVVTLATAHPLKFSEAVRDALNFEPSFPLKQKKIFNLKEKYEVLDNSYEEVRDYIKNKS